MTERFEFEYHEKQHVVDGEYGRVGQQQFTVAERQPSSHTTTVILNFQADNEAELIAIISRKYLKFTRA